MSQIKKVKIIYEYNGKQFNLDIDAFKPLSFIRSQIKKNIFPEKDFKFMYLNREIDLSHNVSIGEYFSNKSIITIKLLKSDNNVLANKLKLPLINSIHSYDIKMDTEHFFKQKDYFLNRSTDNYSNNHLEDDIPIQANLTFLCDCAINFISFFCRQCVSFVCKRCRVNVNNY